MRSFFTAATYRKAEEGIGLAPMTDDNAAICRGSRKRKVIVAITIDNHREMLYTNSNKNKAVEQSGNHIEGS